MVFYERVGVLHVHTTLSDGTAEYDELARLANDVGIDVLLITDHNVYAGEREGWYGNTLVLVGEELHDPAADRAQNHLLALGAGEELNARVSDAQRLIDAVRQRGGLAFLAHPVEHSGAYSREPEINWVSWQVCGYHGLEIWNYMSEFKSTLTELGSALLYSLWPKLAIRGPYSELLHRWDRLLASEKIVAIGGVDAHGTVYRLGPLRRAIFGYKHLFRSLTTHLLLDEEWSGEAAHDGALVYAALRRGRAFIVHERLGSGQGFRFTAQAGHEMYTLGDEFLAKGSVRLHVRAPKRARLRLLLNGHCIAETRGSELVHESRAPGAYRVEAYRRYALRERMWIVSNPIMALRSPRTPGATTRSGT
jgi:hypothetical protein